MCTIVPNFVKIGQNVADVGKSELGKKGQKPQNLQKWVLGAVRGHSRSLAMSPLLDHT